MSNTIRPQQPSDHGLDIWRTLNADQQPTWADHPDYAPTVAELEKLPPLVFAGEVDSMRHQLAEVAEGRAFLLQGGDCAETFAGATADKISGRVRTILQMAAVLTYGASMPVVKMGRIAGQFSKPRSSDVETRDGVTLPSFRGETVNGHEFTAEARTHDPKRMLRGYHTSSATLNLVRAFTKGGFADLRSVHQWNRGFTENPAHARYEETAREIGRALKFMEACGVDFNALTTTDLYVGHEALVLDFERALTRIDSRTHQPYDTSAHFLWIGERTRGINDAHVDFLSKVRNPIGVKLGPSTTLLLSPAWGQRTFVKNFPLSLRGLTHPGRRSCGLPTPCTATLYRFHRGLKLAGLTISWMRCAASLRCMSPWALSPVASTLK